jgi:ligand-binding sensor protein
MPEKKLSEEAQWFLRNLQKIQEDFANELKMLMVLVNKEGKVILPATLPADPCKIIQSTEEGAKRCGNCYKDAVSAFTSGKIKAPFFLNCHANFAAMVLPVETKEGIIGAVLGCGGVYNEKDKERVLEIVEEEIGIPKEKLAELVVRLTPVSKEELQKRAERLRKLINILAEETALSEVFEI